MGQRVPLLPAAAHHEQALRHRRKPGEPEPRLRRAGRAEKAPRAIHGLEHLAPLAPGHDGRRPGRANSHDRRQHRLRRRVDIHPTITPNGDERRDRIGDRVGEAGDAGELVQSEHRAVGRHER